MRMFSFFVIILGHLVTYIWLNTIQDKKLMEQGQLDILNLILNAGIVVKLVILILFLFSVYTWSIVMMKIVFFKH